MLSKDFKFNLENIKVLSNLKVKLKLKDYIIPKSKSYVPTLLYDIYDTSNNLVGFIDLRLGHNFNLFYGGNIGYTIYEGFRGNNYSYYATLLLFSLAEKLDLKYLYITADFNNLVSLNILNKLNLELVGLYDLPKSTEMYERGQRMEYIYKKILGGSYDI